MTRYYGHYSNKSRGIRAKAEAIDIEDPDNENISNEVEVIDISKYHPKKVPSLAWRECIKKIWKNDPLICPKCQSEMRIISFIENPKIIKKILKYLNLWDYAFPFTPMGNAWEDESARDPPVPAEIPDEIVYVPIEDAAWDQHENSGFAG
jgi:hypothetical protein